MEESNNMKISSQLIAKMKAEIQENTRLASLFEKFDKAHGENHKALKDEIADYNNYIASLLEANTNATKKE